MANFKNYSLKPDIAHFSLSLIGKLITFSDVVHKALVFCFLFIARCKCVPVFTVNKAISAIHRFRLLISDFQSWVSGLGTAVLFACLRLVLIVQAVAMFLLRAASTRGTAHSNIFIHIIQKSCLKQARQHSSSTNGVCRKERWWSPNPFFSCIFVSLCTFVPYSHSDFQFG